MPTVGWSKERYSKSMLALEDILRPGRPLVKALADLLERAAKIYTRDPEMRGCLVLEAARGSYDDESAILAHRAAEHRAAKFGIWSHCRIRMWLTLSRTSPVSCQGYRRARARTRAKRAYRRSLERQKSGCAVY